MGALKAAHVGVSLCEAEASVAAPLTSKRQTIACMLAVVAEGRCSLSTSYLIFKFIILYAFIQVRASSRRGGARRWRVRNFMECSPCRPGRAQCRSCLPHAAARRLRCLR